MVSNGVFLMDSCLRSLSSSSGTPKCLTYIVTIAMFDKSKLPSMKKNQKVMVAEVVYLLGAYARNDLGCNRRVGGLCSCVSYQLVHLEVRLCEVEFGYNYFTTFCRHVILQVLKLFTIREQNTKVWTVIYPRAKFEKAAPVTIEMFDKSKLTTSTSVPCDYRRCTEFLPH